MLNFAAYLSVQINSSRDMILSSHSFVYLNWSVHMARATKSNDSHSIGEMFVAGEATSCIIILPLLSSLHCYCSAFDSRSYQAIRREDTEFHEHQAE
jgi:hypothetical protein